MGIVERVRVVAAGRGRGTPDDDSMVEDAFHDVDGDTTASSTEVSIRAGSAQRPPRFCMVRHADAPCPVDTSQSDHSNAYQRLPERLCWEVSWLMQCG